MTLERFELGSTPSYFFQSATHKYLFASEHLSGSSILDIACGTGYGTNILFERHPDFSFFGCDLDNSAITYAKNHYSKQITFKQCNAYSTGFEDNFFDTIISFETLEHLEDGSLFLKEIKRILKPNGKLICSTPNKTFGERLGSTKEKPLNPYHISLYYHDDFQHLLSSYFTDVSILGQTESAAELFFRFPFLYKMYRKIKPILLPFITKKSSSSEIVFPNKLNSKFKPRKFWKSAYYMVGLCSNPFK